MDAWKRKRMEAAGWKVGTATEFLGLSAEEHAFVETRLAVSRIQWRELPGSRLVAMPQRPRVHRAVVRRTFQPLTITRGAAPPRSRVRTVALSVRVSPGSSET